MLMQVFGSSWAQDVEFTVQAPNIVAVGEQFRVVYTLNVRPAEFFHPNFGSFAVLAGPSTASSSSVQIVNGKMSQTHSYSYTYIVEATTEGQQTIGPAKVTVGRDSHETQALVINVVSGGGSSPRQQGGQQAQTRQQAQSADTQQELFVTVELDRKTVFRGQPLLATIQIYTRHGISGFEDVKFPQFTGFWNQELETPNRINFERVNLDGRIYNRGVIRKYLLIPQRSGELTIDPFEIVTLYQQRAGSSQSIFDDFFGAYQTQSRRLTSKPLTVTVKNLPPNAPPSFTGAVGKYTFDATFDKNSLKTNEAATLRMRVSGSGNLRLVESPRVEYPASWEVFDPKVIDNLTTTQEGISGIKTFEQVFIPRTPGQIELNRIEFTYFDPSKEQYVTLRSQPLALSIEADESEQQQPQLASFGKEDVRFIGKDIRFIKTTSTELKANGNFLLGSTTYTVTCISVVSAFVGLFFLITRKRKLEGNVVLVRTRKANRVARKRLQAVRQFLEEGNADRFYEELLRALWGYVSDKLSIPLAHLSADSARETLLGSGVEGILVDDFMKIIEECEYARYAPKEQLSPMANLYDSAHATISRLEGMLR